MAGRLMRRGVALIVLALLLAVAAAMQARAQGADDLDALNKQVETLYSEGKYAEATAVAKRSLALAEKKFGPDHPSVGTSLNNLAELYGAQGRYAEAEKLHKRNLSISEKALGPDHPSVGIALNNLAGLYRAQGRYAEAEDALSRGDAAALEAIALVRGLVRHIRVIPKPGRMGLEVVGDLAASAGARTGREPR